MIRRPVRAPRRGFSLVEMIMATALTAGTLAPALVVLRDAMASSRQLVRRSLAANYAEYLLEHGAALTPQNWGTGTLTGSFASEGQPSLRYVLVRTDDPANGGLTGRLIHLRVTVYDDANSNSVQDANEIAVNYRTKIAKLTTYENEPN